MSRTFRIITAIVSLIIVVVMLGLSIVAITIPSMGMLITCLMMAVMGSAMCYQDYQYFFGKKPDVADKKV